MSDSGARQVAAPRFSDPQNSAARLGRSCLGARRKDRNFADAGSITTPIGGTRAARLCPDVIALFARGLSTRASAMPAGSRFATGAAKRDEAPHVLIKPVPSAPPLGRSGSDLNRRSPPNVLAAPSSRVVQRAPAPSVGAAAGGIRHSAGWSRCIGIAGSGGIKLRLVAPASRLCRCGGIIVRCRQSGPFPAPWA